MAVCLFWLAIWQVLAVIVGNSLLLPAPWETAKALGGLMVTGKFYRNIGWTVLRCLLAMGLSFGAGVLAAWLAHKVRAVRDLLSLPVGFFKAVPVMAIIIYVILLAKSDWVAVIVCFFMCFPIVYTNILAGIDAMPVEFLEVGKIYRLSQSKVIKLIYAPGLLPQIKASISLIAGLSWKAVVAAEVLSIPKYSLGYEMINSKYYLETANLFAYILVIVVLSMGFERLIKMGLRRIEWRGYEGSKIEKGDWGDLEACNGDPKDFNGDPKACRRDLNGGNGAHDAAAGSAILSSPDVEVVDLSKSFGERKVLDSVNLTFKGRRVTAVTGSSGKGKTTLARIILGLEDIDGGYVKFGGPHRDSFLFQEDRLLPWLNIYDNIKLSKIDGECKERIFYLARQLEIESELWHLPGELSGGMRHRVALGRTFLAETNLMVLDEPFRGLDESLKLRIVDRLWERETKGKTVILITHNPEDAKMLGNTIVEI